MIAAEEVSVSRNSKEEGTYKDGQEFERGEWMSETHEAKFGTRFTARNAAWFKWDDKWTVRKLKELYSQGPPRNDLDVIQFGVYTGVGPKCICEKLAQAGVRFGRFVGFDSFTGLPPEADKITSEQMEGDHWNEGAFSACDALEEYDRDRLLERITATIAYPDTVLVPGMFSESLTDELAATMRPAMFVDVDCDLYISARQCLEWMAKHRLWFPGTVVRYDDWKGTPGA